MKKFETPELNVVKFEIEDVITTSPVGGWTPGDNETGGDAL